MKQWHVTWLWALRVTFCRNNKHVPNYVQYKYTKLQKLPLDISDSIKKMQSVQMGVLISPDKILESI